MTVSINNDRNLIEGLLHQSQRAQQQLLSNYGSYVFAQVARLIPSQADAEEVYQDVFVRVFSHISMFDPQRSSLKTWISRIAYNESISFLRQRSLPVVSFDDHESEACAISEQEVDETFGRPNADTVQLIRTALRHLPADERAIITMFYYEEMSIKDIAFVTESLPTTIASRLSRIRKKLCRIIKMLQS